MQVTLAEFLQFHKLRDRPFMNISANKDPILDRMIEDPRFQTKNKQFYIIASDGSAVAFGAKGSGKTAIKKCSNMNMLRKRYFFIIYDDFMGFIQNYTYRIEERENRQLQEAHQRRLRERSLLRRILDGLLHASPPAPSPLQVE
jgi:hypothetical protein